MNFEEVTKNVFHINFSSRYELTSTFLRFQEHFESPEFMGKMFTLNEYKKWYIPNSPKGKKTGKFTYFSDWGGFNIPSIILKPFYEGEFNPLSRKEKKLLNLFKHKKGKKFYIIGTFGNLKIHTLKHEIAHGLFYTNEEYKKEVLGILKKIDKELRNKINNFLSNSGGYHHSVWLDETHAYLISDYEKLKKAGINIPSLLKFSKELNKIFKKYYNC